MSTHSKVCEYTIEIFERECYPGGYDYIAQFDTYDGAPDGDTCYGSGDTHGEAIMSLIENYRFDDER